MTEKQFKIFIETLGGIRDALANIQTELQSMTSTQSLFFEVAERLLSLKDQLTPKTSETPSHGQLPKANRGIQRQVAQEGRSDEGASAQ